MPNPEDSGDVSFNKFNIRNVLRISWKIYKFKFVEFTAFAFLYLGLTFFSSFFWGGIISAILVTIITIPMGMGIYIIAHRIYYKIPFTFINFFDAFKYFSKIVYLVALNFLVIYPLIAGSFYGGVWLVKHYEVALWQKAILFTVLPGLGLYFSIILLFSPLFIFFKSYGVWDSIVESARYIHRDFFRFFLFVILGVSFSFVGLLALGIGFLIVTTYWTIATYVAFQQIVGFTEEEIEQEREEIEFFSGLN